MIEDSVPNIVDGETAIETSKLDVKSSADQRAADNTQDRIRTLLLSVTNKAQLETVMDELSYTAEGIKTLRESLPEGPERARVLNAATEILLDGWKHNAGKSGKMATLLSQTSKDWKPAEETVGTLVTICERAMKKDDSARVATVQPLAYALGAIGKLDFYGKWLQTTTMKAPWREADLERNEEYYASKTGTPRENQLAAIERHLKDPNRTGLLRAHDIGLLYQIRESQLDELRGSDDPEVVRTNKLLRETVDVLEAHKQDKLVAYIRQHRTI